MEERERILFDALSEKQLYTKTYEEFVTQFSNEESRRKLHEALYAKQLYTKSYEDFDSQFFTVKKKEPSFLDFLESGQKSTADSTEQPRSLDESLIPQQPLPTKKKDTGSYAGDMLERIGAQLIDIATSGPKKLKFAKKLMDIPKEIAKKELSILGLSDEVAEKIASNIPFIKPEGIDASVKLSSAVWDKIGDTEGFKETQNKANELREASARYDKLFSEYLKGKEYGKALGLAILSGAESLPITIEAALGGPAGLLDVGFYSASMQYDQLAANADMTEVQKISNALANGAFEILTEKLGSANYGKLLKKLYKTVGIEQAEVAIKGALKNWLSKMWKRFGIYTAPAGESIEEGINQFAGNLTARITGEDIDRPLDYGVIDQMGSGFGGGTFFIGPGMFAQARAQYYEAKLKQKEKLAKEQAKAKEPSKTTDKGTVTTEVGELEVPEAVRKQFEEDNLSLSKDELKEMKDAEKKTVEEPIEVTEEPTVPAEPTPPKAEIPTIESLNKRAIDYGLVETEQGKDVVNVILGTDELYRAGEEVTKRTIDKIPKEEWDRLVQDATDIKEGRVVEPTMEEAIAGEKPEVYYTPEQIENKPSFGEESYVGPVELGPSAGYKGKKVTIEEIPDQLYHVTTSLGAINKSGKLKAGEKGGLGGGQMRGVSFTTDKTIADRMVRVMQQAIRLMNASETEAKSILNEMAMEDSKIAGKKLNNQSEYWDTRRKLKEPLDDTKDMVLKSYLQEAERASKKLIDPLLFNVANLKGKSIEDVGIIELNKQNIPKNAAIVEGTDKFLSEIRVLSEVPITPTPAKVEEVPTEVKEEDVRVKNLPNTTNASDNVTFSNWEQNVEVVKTVEVGRNNTRDVYKTQDGTTIFEDVFWSSGNKWATVDLTLPVNDATKSRIKEFEGKLDEEWGYTPDGFGLARFKGEDGVERAYNFIKKYKDSFTSEFEAKRPQELSPTKQVEEEPAKESNIYNKQQVIESLLSEYPEEVREQVRNSFARAENFDEMAAQAGFNSLGGGQYTRESVAKVQEDVVQKEPTEPISKPVEPLSTQEGIPAPPKVEEVVEVKEKGEGEKYRKTQINALIQDESLQQQEIAKIVDANKEKYTVLHQADAVEQAKAFIDSQGVRNATNELIEPTRKMADFPMRQVARQVLLDFYSRAIIDPNAKESDKKEAFTAIDKLQSITAREATKAGQGNALLQVWKSMQPSGLLEYVARKIATSNQKTLDKKIGDSTLGEQLDALYETLNEESKKIILDILAGKPISMPKQEERPIREAPKRKTVPKERIKKEQEYRKNLLDQYRKSEKPMAMAVTGLTSSQIELGGNLVASYIREGYYRMQDIVDRLIKDLKSVDIDADEKNINDIFKQPKTNKETLGEYIDKVESKARTRSAEKNINKRISDVITEHWSVKDELKRTLAQKLVDEAGLTEEEASRLEKEILDKFDKEIISRSEKQLTKLLGTTKLPQEKKAKNIVGKMVELINMGALDEDLYRDLFAEKFNLVKLTDVHKEEILKLANNVQLASGKGWLERDATIRLAKYIFELYPESRSGEVFDTWISMAYANMLAGPTTSILNMWSAGWNMSTKPIRDLSNLSKWLRLVKDATKGEGDIYNPFGEMFYSPMLRGSQAGLEQAQEVYRNGDLNNKYVEDVAKKNQFKVTQLERDKYGKSKRFKPVNVKIGNKTIDLNLFNAYKYSGRNLSAQDKFMLTTSYEVELAHILRDKLKNRDLKGKALTHEVMSILRGDHIDMEELNANLESEALLYHQMTGEWMTDLQKKIRKREMMLDQLPLTPEEKEEAERLARSNIFTDDRFGVIATMANAIGAAANKSYTAGLIIKPFIPFTKVVGNVAEYMLDHVPFYGFMRANGKSISYIKRLIDSEAQTAQMGERGSRAYYEQMGRAWLGTMSFIVMGMLFLGRDDEDFMEVSGGYLQEGFKKKGRENVLPPYTLRIGNVKIPYKNIPALAIPLALIGNVNDALKSKQDEGEVMDRFTVALFLEACQNTVFMFKDMSFLDGAQRLAQIASDIASTDEKKWTDISENAIKSYLGFATRPLPQNNNAVQQIWKFFDPESYPQNDIKGTLMYAAGVQHFSKYTAIDQLGDAVTSYPGETLMPYTHWFKIKGEDERWKFLAKYNAIPNKIYNRVMQIDTPTGVEKRKLEEDELYEYSKRSGDLFSKKVIKYMSDKEKVAKRGSEIIEREKSNGEIEKINGIREDVEKLWGDAKKQSETELFKWSLFKEKFPKKWEILKDNQALQMPQSSMRDIFMGEEAEKLKFNEEDIAKFNTRAMELYSDMVIPTIQAMDSESRKRKLPTGETEYDYIINSLWTAAKQQAKAEIVEEKMATKK